MMKRSSQKQDESAIEFLRRAVGWCDHESETLLSQLPSTDAVLDFFDLWHAYGTDFWQGIIECIAEGEDPEPARKFIRKWKLDKGWSQDVNEAAKLAKSTTAPARQHQ